MGKRLNRRLADLGLPTLTDYRERLRADPTEWAVLDSFCRITISRFYRDPRVFDILRFRVLPELARAAHLQCPAIRCWCAGCACGEEVYTLKLIWELDARRSAPETSLELIGTDADLEVLSRAERGCYPSSSLDYLPKDWRALAFTRDDGEYCIRREFRGAIAFRFQDIGSDFPDGLFDLILCRNLVFTYFEFERQRDTLARIAAALRSTGYLVIGAHEELPAQADQFASVHGCKAILRRTDG